VDNLSKIKCKNVYRIQRSFKSSPLANIGMLLRKPQTFLVYADGNPMLYKNKSPWKDTETVVDGAFLCGRVTLV
jgi:hypothetical protein